MQRETTEQKLLLKYKGDIPSSIQILQYVLLLHDQFWRLRVMIKFLVRRNKYVLVTFGGIN